MFIYRAVESIVTEHAANENWLPTFYHCCQSFCLLPQVATPDEEPIDARCQRLEKDCTADRQQLEDSKAWRAALEEERDTLKRENSSLLDALAKARQDADRLVADRLEALRELDMEKSRMDELKQEIKLFSQAFSLRQGQLTSLYTKSKAIVENCKTSQLALPWCFFLFFFSSNCREACYAFDPSATNS